MYMGTKLNRLDILVRISILAVLLVIAFPTNAQDWPWAHAGNGLLTDKGSAISFDAAGNVYATGQFAFSGGPGGSGSITFDTITLLSEGQADCFLVKYSPEGDVLWARSGGSELTDGCRGVAMDAAGNAHMAGYFGLALPAGGTATFGPFILTTAGLDDILVVKYSREGDVLWAESGGGTLRDQAADIDVDAAGNAYVVGPFEETASFGPFILTSAGDYDAFLVKYSPEGDVLWARSGGGPLEDFVLDVALDASGNAYIAGFFYGTATFGPFTITSAGSSDCFLVKYSPEGDVIWARRCGGGSREIGRSIAVNANGDIYFAGRFLESTSFGPYSASAVDGGNDAFLAKFSPDGDVLWLQTGGGPRYDEAHSVDVDAAGDAYITGYFYDTIVFGQLSLVNTGSRWDAFVVKYSQDGEAVWGQSSSGNGDELSYGIAVRDDGTFAITGAFDQTATFGSNAVTTAGFWDVFVAKHAPPVVAVEPVIGPAEELVLSAVYPNPFASTGHFELTVREAQHVTVEVLDLLGRRVALLYNAGMAANQAHSFVIEARGLPSGLYTVWATGEHFSAVRRIALVR